MSPEGAIVEVGGPLAEALQNSRNSTNGLRGINAGGNVYISKVSSFGGLTQTFRSGMFNGVFYVNNEIVAIPEVREQLRISIPAGRICDVEIDAEYFGQIDIQTTLHAKLNVSVSSSVKLSLWDQPNLTAARLMASMGAAITGNQLTATGGRVKLNADMDDSKLTFGKVTADSIKIGASCGGQVTTDNLRGTTTVDLEAGMSDSRIDCGHVSGVVVTTKTDLGGRIKGKNVSARDTLKLGADGSGSLNSFIEACAETIDADADMSGAIQLETSNSKRLRAAADMSGRITIDKGSAMSGKARADMSGRVKLTGDFGRLSKKRDMGGEVLLTADKGDAGVRFSNAAKRGYNRTLWGNQHATAVSLAIAAAMAPMMKDGMAEALADDTFVELVCSAMEPSYADAAVDAAIRKCGTLFAEQVPTEELQDTAKVQAAFAQPAVLAAFGEAAQAFLTTTFSKAQELAK